jgi:hypothetical protein
VANKDFLHTAMPEPLPAHFDQPISLTVGEGIFAFKGYSPEEIAYHVRIMTQGDLISMGGIDEKGNIGKYYGFRWHGHEFLDDVRDPDIWRKTKKRAKAVGGVGARMLARQRYQGCSHELRMVTCTWVLRCTEVSQNSLF